VLCRVLRHGSRRRQVLLHGDAEALPFSTSGAEHSAGLFDAVTCNFGVLHLGRPEDFFAEAHRVLRPGGRLAFTVWAAPPATEGFAITLGALGEHGDPNVALPAGPPRARSHCPFVLPLIQFIPYSLL
jgi:SAM-dependent methyltransferase